MIVLCFIDDGPFISEVPGSGGWGIRVIETIELAGRGKASSQSKYCKSSNSARGFSGEQRQSPLSTCARQKTA